MSAAAKDLVSTERAKLRRRLIAAETQVGRFGIAIGGVVSNPAQRERIRKPLLVARTHIAAAWQRWEEGDFENARDQWTISHTAFAVAVGLLEAWETKAAPLQAQQDVAKAARTKQAQGRREINEKEYTLRLQNEANDLRKNHPDMLIKDIQAKLLKEPGTNKRMIRALKIARPRKKLPRP